MPCEPLDAPRESAEPLRTIYPPASQWLFALAAALAPSSVVGWRLLLLLFEAATGVLLLALLRRLGAPPTAIIVYAWSPLVVFEGAQAGHVEVAVIFLVLLGLVLRQTGSSALAGAALGLAILVKLYPVVLLPAWSRREDWRFPAATAATVGLGYLPYAAALGASALGFLPEYFASSEDHNIGLRALLTYPFGFTGEVARGVAIALAFAAIAATVVVIGRSARHDVRGLWRASALAVGAYLLLVPTAMHPWYVMWIVPFPHTPRQNVASVVGCRGPPSPIANALTFAVDRISQEAAHVPARWPTGRNPPVVAHRLLAGVVGTSRPSATRPSSRSGSARTSSPPPGLR